MTSLLATAAIVCAASTASAEGPNDGSGSADGGGMTGQQIGEIVGLGVGVVGFGVGIGYGIAALSEKSDAQKVCPGSLYCSTTAGVNKWSDAETAASVSTVGFVVGLGGLLEAAILWWAPPPQGHEDDGPKTRVGVGPGSVQLTGSF